GEPPDAPPRRGRYPVLIRRQTRLNRTTGDDDMFDEQELTAVVVEAEQGRSLWHLGALMTFKALGAETGGRFWALEGLADRRMAVPLHVHSREDEVWYVLEGEIRF